MSKTKMLLEPMKTVWIYTDTSKPVGDLHQLLVFADQDSANAWFKEFDPEGVAFEYPLIGKETANETACEDMNMAREAAKLLLDTALRHAAEQDAALAAAERLCSQEEFATYKLMVGKTMGAMLLDLINPIVSRYPDLKPPEMI